MFTKSKKKPSFLLITLILLSSFYINSNDEQLSINSNILHQQINIPEVNVNCTNSQEFLQNSKIHIEFQVTYYNNSYYRYFQNETLYFFDEISNNDTSVIFLLDTSKIGYLNLSFILYSSHLNISSNLVLDLIELNVIIIENIDSIWNSPFGIGVSIVGIIGGTFFFSKVWKSGFQNKIRKIFSRKLNSDSISSSRSIESLIDKNLEYSKSELGKITKYYTSFADQDNLDINSLKQKEFWDNF